MGSSFLLSIPKIICLLARNCPLLWLDGWGLDFFFDWGSLGSFSLFIFSANLFFLSSYLCWSKSSGWSGTNALFRIFYGDSFSGGYTNLYLVWPAFHLIRLIIHVSIIVAPSDTYAKLSGVSDFWLALSILMTLLMSDYLICRGSMSMSSILNVIEFIISRAVVQLGATQPLNIHTMLNTFSTSGFGGFTEDLNSTMCALVSLRRDWSVILTAYWNSSSVSSISSYSSSPGSLVLNLKPESGCWMFKWCCSLRKLFGR